MAQCPGRVHTMSAAENAAARIDADLYFPAHVKTLYQKFSVEAGEKVAGHDAYLVTGRSEGQPPLCLYMDKESGLLLRLVRYAELLSAATQHRSTMRIIAMRMA